MTGGKTVIVDNRVVILLDNQKVEKATSDFARKLQNIEGLERVRFSDDDPQNDVVLSRDDLPAFAAPPIDDPENAEAVNESVRNIWLRPVSVNFEGDYIWRFTDGGPKPFSAHMKDMQFAARVSDGRVALSAGDTMLCEVKEVQRLAPNGELKTETFILDVIQYRSGPRQQSIDFDKPK